MAAPSIVSLACEGCKPNLKPLSKKKKHQIIVEQRDTTPDTHGTPANTWATFGTYQAAVEPLRGREFFAADQANSEVTTRIRIDYVSGITAKMRVSFESRYYNIKAIRSPRHKPGRKIGKKARLSLRGSGDG